LSFLHVETKKLAFSGAKSTSKKNLKKIRAKGQKTRKNQESNMPALKTSARVVFAHGA